jgi:membrane peptidoglycan carboxypeptidase
MDLSTHEQIALIALLKSPSQYSNNYEKWTERIKIYAKVLYNNSLISYEEYEDAQEIIKTNINQNYIPSSRLYFVDKVLEEFNKGGFIAKFGTKVIIKTYYNNKTEIIDSDLDINISLISINKNGYITTLIGDKDYRKSNYNIAINGTRDIGSTIKPLLYYEAIKCGFRSKVFLSEPYNINYKDTNVTIANSSGNYYNEYIDMKTALASSDNIYAVKMHMHLGMNTLVNTLKQYQIKSEPIISLALGSVGMSLLDLTRIYTQFFLDGIYVNPICIYKIAVNNKEYIYKPSKTKMLNGDICKEIKDMMGYVFSNKIKYATCKWVNPYLKVKCYGKSGLTDYDSYMIGFTEDNLVSVWCGHADNSLLTNKEHKRLPKELFIKAINLVSPSGTN